MKKKQVMAIEFNHSKEGLKLTEEEFKADCLQGLEFILKSRENFYKQQGQSIADLEEKDVMPLPTIVGILFEDGSYANTLLYPESDQEKEALLTGAKRMMAKYNISKKIKAVALMMEAFMASMDLNEYRKAHPITKEMSDDQLTRRINREWSEGKVNKITRVIFEYQTPVIENNKQQTWIETRIYSLFEHRVLQLDDKLTEAMNEGTQMDTKQKRKPWFSFFTDLGSTNDMLGDNGVLNLNIGTAVAFLKTLNKLMN